jgi:hypothetical protein
MQSLVNFEAQEVHILYFTNLTWFGKWKNQFRSEELGRPTATGLTRISLNDRWPARQRPVVPLLRSSVPPDTSHGSAGPRR